MYKQYILSGLRNIIKNRFISSVTFINLMVGFTTFILITLFVVSEYSWDKHNENYDRIYRLQLFMDQPENVIKHSSSVTAALSRNELSRIPAVEKSVLIHDVGDNNKDGIFLSPDRINQFKIRWGFYADPTAFDIFTFEFIEGIPATALQEPYSVVLSESVARKMFPGEKAVGKPIYAENKVVLTVTGVYRDLPVGSTWRPSYIIPINTFTPLTGWKNFDSNYWAYSFYTYVLLKPGTQSAQVDSLIYNSLKNYQKEHHPYLRPLSLLHLNPYYQKDIYVVLILLSFTALLILLLASLNFINMQTARATTRLKEIGIKKTAGFSKQQLYMQFIAESVLISFLAGALSVILAQMVLPLFRYMIGATGVVGVSITPNLFSEPAVIGLVLLVSVITGFLSGLYPAYIISSFNPVKALKEKVITDSKFSLKKILVTSQFFISLFLLIVSFIIFRQTIHMSEGNFGFNSQDVVVSNITTNRSGSFESIRQQLLRHPEIADASFSDYIPMVIPGGDDINWEGGNTEEKVFIRDYQVSHHYFSTYDIPIVQGRNFSTDHPDDYQKCIINETAVRVFGWDDPIGKFIDVENRKVEVIGVIRDYIAQSMHNPIEPHWYHLIRDSASLSGYFSVKIKPGEYQKAMKLIKDEFSVFFPGDVFEFTHIGNLIRDEAAANAWKVIRNLSVFFSILSIIISAAGLFALVMFYARKKMKEISIRKVLGFGVETLYAQLVSEFMWLMLIAAVLAWPAAYMVYKALPGAYKYQIQIWEFLTASGIMFIIAILTISWHILKLIRQNPVEVLKYE